MVIARITEISSTSETGFDDAIDRGIARATRTLRDVRSASGLMPLERPHLWVKEQRVEITDDQVSEYQVNLLVTFVLDDEE